MYKVYFSEPIETEEKGEKGDGEDNEGRKKGRRQSDIRTMFREMVYANEICPAPTVRGEVVCSATTEREVVIFSAPTEREGVV